MSEEQSQPPLDEDKIHAELAAKQNTSLPDNAAEKKAGIPNLEISSGKEVEVVRIDLLYESARSIKMVTLPLHERRIIPGRMDLRGRRQPMSEVVIPTSARPQTGQSREDWIYAMIMKYYPSARMEPFFFSVLDSVVAVAKGQKNASRAFAAQGDPASGKSFATRLWGAILSGVEDPNNFPMIDCTRYREAEELFADIQINSNGSTSAPAIVVDGELTTAVRLGQSAILDEVNHIGKTGALHGMAEMMAGSIGTITITAGDNKKYRISRDDLPANFFLFMSGNKIGQGSALPFPEPVISRLGQGFGFFNIPDADARSFATAFAGEYMGMRGANALLDVYGKDNMDADPRAFFRVLESVLQKIYFGKEIPEEIYWRADQWQRSLNGCERVGVLFHDLKLCFSNDGLEQVLDSVSSSLGINGDEIRKFRQKVSNKVQDLKPEIDERIIPKLFASIRRKAKQEYKAADNLHREGHEENFNDLKIFDNDPVNNFGTLLYQSVKEWLETTIVEPMALKGNELEYMTKLIDALMERAGLHPNAQNSVIDALNVDLTALKLARSAEEIQRNAYEVYKIQYPNSQQDPNELFPISALIEQLSKASKTEATRIVSVPVNGRAAAAVVGSDIIQSHQRKGPEIVSYSVDEKALIDLRQFMLSLSMPGIGRSNISSILEVAKFEAGDIDNLSDSEQLRLGLHPSGIAIVSASTLLKLRGSDYRADLKIVTNQNTGTTIVVLPSHAPRELVIPDNLLASLYRQKVYIFTAGEKDRISDLTTVLQGEEIKADAGMQSSIKTALSLGFDTTEGLERDEKGNLKISLEDLLLSDLKPKDASMVISHEYQIDVDKARGGQRGR